LIKRHNEETGGKFSEISKRLGERGWELVSHTPIVGQPYGTSTPGLVVVLFDIDGNEMFMERQELYPVVKNLSGLTTREFLVNVREFG